MTNVSSHIIAIIFAVITSVVMTIYLIKLPYVLYPKRYTIIWDHYNRKISNCIYDVVFYVLCLCISMVLSYMLSTTFDINRSMQFTISHIVTLLIGIAVYFLVTRTRPDSTWAVLMKDINTSGIPLLVIVVSFSFLIYKFLLSQESPPRCGDAIRSDENKESANDNNGFFQNMDMFEF